VGRTRRNEDGQGVSFIGKFVDGVVPEGSADIGLLGCTQLAAVMVMRTIVMRVAVWCCVCVGSAAPVRAYSEVGNNGA